MNDCEKLILTEQEQRVFDKFKKVNSTELTETEFALLRRKGLVDNEQLLNAIDLTHIVRLSMRGQEFRAYQKLSRKQQHKEDLRYLITTLIALAALIISLITMNR